MLKETKLSPRELITILTVYQDKRDLGKIGCFRKNQLKECVSFIKELGLKYKVYDKYLIYLSRKENLIKKAIQFHHFPNKVKESESSNIILGKLYGYPDCCIKIFTENDKLTRQDNDLGVLLKSFENSKSNIFPIYTNWFFTCKPVLHLPHSFNCQPSVRMGKQNLEILKKYDRKMHQYIIEKLHGCVLVYKNRVLLINDFNIKQENVIFKPQPWLDMSSLFNLGKSFNSNSWLGTLVSFKLGNLYKIDFNNQKGIKVLVFSK